MNEGWAVKSVREYLNNSPLIVVFEHNRNLQKLNHGSRKLA